MEAWQQRICQNPNILHGELAIRGHRISVRQILDMLESGNSVDEILKGFPSLEREDIEACIEYSRSHSS